MRHEPMKPQTFDLFADAEPEQQPRREQIGEQSYVLRGFALPWLERLLPALEKVLAAAPFRQMVTPGGFTMSVALSSCGQLGWTTDRSGYRYTRLDPQTAKPWPMMPEVFFQLAQAAAQAAGFTGFAPDSCLINRYIPGAKMSLHQDKDEHPHRFGIPGFAGDVPVRRFCTQRQKSARSPVPWRHRGLGRRGSPALSRRVADQGRPSSETRRATHQLHLPYRRIKPSNLTASAGVCGNCPTVNVQATPQ